MSLSLPRVPQCRDLFLLQTLDLTLHFPPFSFLSFLSLPPLPHPLLYFTHLVFPGTHSAADRVLGGVGGADR